MSGSFIAFFLLSLFIFTGAVFMLNFTRVVHMIFSIAFTFLSIAGLYVLLEAEFVAVVQVLVYTGAVSILMVFGIMLTRHDVREEQRQRKGHANLVLAAVILLAGALMWAISSAPWLDRSVHLAENHTLEIGKALFTRFVIPFELVSVLLLVALVGAIIMAKDEGESK